MEDVCIYGECDAHADVFPDLPDIYLCDNDGYSPIF